MSIGKGVLYSKKWARVPTGRWRHFFTVAKPRFVVIGLTQVMQKGNKRKGFFAVLRFIKIPFHQHMIYIQVCVSQGRTHMLQEAGRGGRREKSVVQSQSSNLSAYWPCDIFTKNAQKFFLYSSSPNFHFF